MSSASSSDKSQKKGSKPKSNEEILMGFQKLRTEQRYLSTKLSEMELELHEHKLVIDTLKDLDGDRKCFRMVGGVLCERTVKDVLPILKTNVEQLTKVIESLNQQLLAKGLEINTYKEDNNVKIKGIDELSQVSESDSKTASSGGGGVGGSGVLVS